VPKCPICNNENEYDEKINERCSRCGWDLSFYFKRESFKDKVTSFLGGEGEVFLKSAETWAIWSWKELQKLNSELKNSKETQEKIQIKLEQQSELEKKVKELENRLDEVLNDAKEKQLLLLLEEKIEEKIAEKLSQVNVNTTVSEPRAAICYSDTEESIFIQKEASLVEIYNDNYNLLSNCATIVKVTDESVHEIVSGVPEKIVFKQGKGQYWVILWKDDKQYLVPNPNLVINEHSLRTLEFLFEFVNYPKKESRNIQLLEPAEVYQRDDEWELRVKGEINFK